jgi:hypothetical protein
LRSRRKVILWKRATIKDRLSPQFHANLQLKNQLSEIFKNSKLKLLKNLPVAEEEEHKPMIRKLRPQRFRRGPHRTRAPTVIQRREEAPKVPKTQNLRMIRISPELSKLYLSKEFLATTSLSTANLFREEELFQRVLSKMDNSS